MQILKKRAGEIPDGGWRCARDSVRAVRDRGGGNERGRG